MDNFNVLDSFLEKKIEINCNHISVVLSILSRLLADYSHIFFLVRFKALFLLTFFKMSMCFCFSMLLHFYHQTLQNSLSHATQTHCHAIRFTLHQSFVGKHQRGLIWFRILCIFFLRLFSWLAGFYFTFVHYFSLSSLSCLFCYCVFVRNLCVTRAFSNACIVVHAFTCVTVFSVCKFE